MTELISAAVLGVIEGITEFLPVSSTGHLVLASKALNLDGPKIATFDIFIQLGAILAVVLLYYRRFLDLLDFSQKNGSPGGFRGFAGLSKLAAACLPVFILGAIFHSKIKELLSSELPVAFALLIGGIILILVEQRREPSKVNSIDELSYRQCFYIGLFQCLALWPGVSRSGSTIVGAMLLGVNRSVAAEFSFLVAVPVMCAAVGFDLLKSYKELGMSDVPMFATGFFVALICAGLAVKLFIGMMQRVTLRPFGYYRIALALVVLWYSMA